jgi:hypothetical protein
MHYIQYIQFPLVLSGNIRSSLGAYVIAHGTTDLDTSYWPLIYLPVIFIPLPPPAILILFCSASIIHFAEDSNIYGSLLLHCACTIIGKLRGISTALNVMFSYLTFVHTPLHYYRCWKQKRFFGLKLAGLNTGLLLVGLNSFSLNYLLINSLTQRIVISHILCEYAFHTNNLFINNK